MQVIEKMCYWFGFFLHTEEGCDSKNKVIKGALSVLKCSPERMSVLQCLVTWLS